MPRFDPPSCLLPLIRSLLLGAVALLASAAVVASGASGIDPDIDAIEKAGRGDPQAALERIDRQLGQSSALSPEQSLMLTTLRGVFLSDVGKEKEANQAAAALEAMRHPDARGAAYLVRSNIESQGGNLARSIQMADKAAALLSPAANPRLLFRVETARGWALTELGQFPLALKRYQAAAEIAERIDNPGLMLRAYNSRSSVFAQSGEAARALAENNRALEIANRLNDPHSKTVVWVTRSAIASISGDLDAQVHACQKANEFARQTGSVALIATTDLNLGDAYLRRGRYADVLKISMTAAETAKSVGDESGVAIALANAGQAEIRMGRIAEGKAKIERALESSRRMAARTQLATLLGEYAAALESAGDYKGALNAFHRERELNEEIRSVGEKRALLEVESQYQNERKQREIELLNQKNALQASDLQNRTLQQRIWWLAAGLLVCGMGATGLLYRRVRDANRQLAESNRTLKVRGELDPLTLLFNRRYFLESQAAIPNGAFSGTLCLLDIDHFKLINDQHGHAIGDAVIVEVAKRLRAATRDKDKLMRWGGEEFLVAAPAMPLEQAERLTARLLESVGAAPILAGNIELPVRVSIGFAVFPPHGATVTITWERAANLVDLALYYAKNQGRNRACGITALAATSAKQLEAIEASFPQACNDGHVKVCYLHGNPLRDSSAANAIAPGL